MKIAIQGHPTRGKEVIQILESLGGINRYNHNGCYAKYFYFIGDDNNAIEWTFARQDYFIIYTLKEFEKEFPFKIGDKVIDCFNNEVGTITNLNYITNKLFYNVDFINSGQAFMTSEELKSYKEMEERNITLTFDKAKEWYEKGGELKEVALQAYYEEELTKNELPKTWEEFCKKYRIKKDESYINSEGRILSFVTTSKRSWNHICSSKKSAEAHLALIQLEQLRDCYRQGDIPDFNDYTKKYCIIKIKNHIDIIYSYNHSYFLSFTKKEIAEKFLNNFKPLIKIAEDYI